MKKIVLLPLDERPCNASFPLQLFSHDGIRIVTPEKLGSKKTPADFEAIRSFLLRECRDADGLVISIDMLLYGGLVPSRIHNKTREELLSRLALLRTIREKCPKLPIYGFQCIMRCPDYNSADEEPDYYETYGERIHALGVAVHKNRLGMELHEPIAKSIQRVDQAVIDDYIHRREVNRYLNVESLQLLKDGVLDVLVIPQDDSGRLGYAALDQQIVREKIAEYGVQDQVLMYPGADEVGLTLLARMLNHLYGRRPRVYVWYLSEGARNITPLYEGSRLQDTVRYHLIAAGCRQTQSLENADFVLIFTAPSDRMQEAVSQPSGSLEYVSDRNFPAMRELLLQCLEEHRPVTIADNAYANGSDLEIIHVLDRNGMLLRLAGYAGWNTSANTLGTAVAEAADYCLFGATKEHRNFLAERYVEDAGYCAKVRQDVTEHLPEGMNYFDVKEPRGEAAAMVRKGLEAFVKSDLPSIQDQVEIQDVWLPWSRMFETGLRVVCR